jgi:aminomethyltransferase
VPGNIAGLKPGQARYTVFTNDRGGILDDLIVSNAGAADDLFVVVNAGGREADLVHMRTRLDTAIEITELADRALWPSRARPRPRCWPARPRTAPASPS